MNLGSWIEGLRVLMDDRIEYALCLPLRGACIFSSSAPAVFGHAGTRRRHFMKHDNDLEAHENRIRIDHLSLKYDQTLPLGFTALSPHIR